MAEANENLKEVIKFTESAIVYYDSFLGVVATEAEKGQLADIVRFLSKKKADLEYMNTMFEALMSPAKEEE